VGYDLAVHQGAPYVALTLSGKTGLFLVDTGANASGVDAAWAQALPHRPARTSAHVTGMTGGAGFSQGVFERLDLGHGFFPDPVLDLESFQGFAHPAAGPQVGLLGTDFLNCYALTFDYGRSRLDVALRNERAAAAPGEVAVLVSYVANLPTVAVGIGGLELPCRLDTGASYTDPRVLLDVNRPAFEAICRTVDLRDAGSIYVRGISGAERLRLYEGKLAFELGPVRLEPVVLVVHESGTLASYASPVALAGGSLLARLGRFTLDPFDRALWLARPAEPR
jgi:hypothetical protein